VSAFVDALASRLPPGRVSIDPADLLQYGRDWTRDWTPAPSAVTFPRSTAEVVEILHISRHFGVHVVPSGGRTGLAGGAVARQGEVVLSLERMNRIDPVDQLGQAVRVQAGAITQIVQAHCESVGLTWPIDLAAKGSSTIGGNLATNAGGLKVVRYGHARHWVLGLQVVLASGEVLEIGGALEKDNTGLDLRQLFIGSEGTLGIVTEATLKLTRVPGKLDVLLFGVDGLPAALRLLHQMRQGAWGSLHAFEFFTDFCVGQVVAHRNLPWPLRNRPPAYTLVELEVPDAAKLESWLGTALEVTGVSDGVVAQSSKQASELWAYREDITASLAATAQQHGVGAPHKNDVALPLTCLEAFCAELESGWRQTRKDWPLALFGHLGDGNLHLNTLPPEGMTASDWPSACAIADGELFALVRRHGGSISAEHGVGLMKKPYLHLTRSPAEIAVMRSVKAALDPDNFLNPGKIFDP
jgi:FAD/FMN-containing dehydrogenase